MQKKSATIAAYEAELQKLAYEQQLLDEKVLLEAQKLIQESAKKEDDIKADDIEAVVTSPDEEVTYVPEVEQEVVLPEVDIELQKLREKAKELEELLKN